MADVPSATSDQEAPTRVACLGDSITWGIGATSQFEAYPTQLERMLGNGYVIDDLGVSGRTLLFKGDSPYIKTNSLSQMAEFHPDVVTIMLGTNDTKPQNWPLSDQFTSDYLSLVSQVQTLAPKARIFICTPPFSPRMDTGGINETDVLKEIPMIEDVAKQKGLPVIDIHAATLGRSELFPDRIHPTNEGHHLIALTIYHAITGTDFTGTDFTGTMLDTAVSEWNGCKMLNFEVDGRNCYLVEPKTPLPGNPWIWRMEFFGQYASADQALLGKGYYVAYMDVQNMYGAPVALNHLDKFYDDVTKEYQLAPKVVLEGFSRGGLFALNWAERNPGKVASLYLDAPVCDFKSWPGGKGHGEGSPKDWTNLKKVYGLSDEQALADPTPLDNLKPLADAKIPILSVCGDADITVPVAENTAILKERYEAMGGEIQVILKPGIAHHPHSLTDPTPIVNFILSHP